MNCHTLTHIKRRAKALKKELGVPHHEALDKASQEFGFANYRQFHNSSLPQTGHPNARSRALVGGTLVRLKDFHQDGLVLKNPRPYDDGVFCYTHSGHIYLTRREVSVYRRQALAKEFRPMRLYLPYGKWTCLDGTQVLHNRDYCPLWAKSPIGAVNPIDPDTWVVMNEQKDEWYFDDADAPWDSKVSFQKCLRILDEWGVRNLSPSLLELLPAVVITGDVKMLKAKNYDKKFTNS